MDLINFSRFSRVLRLWSIPEPFRVRRLGVWISFFGVAISESRFFRDLSEIIRWGGGADFKLSAANDVTLPSDGNDISWPFPWAWLKITWPSPYTILDSDKNDSATETFDN